MYSTFVVVNVVSNDMLVKLSTYFKIEKIEFQNMKKPRSAIILIL